MDVVYLAFRKLLAGLFLLVILLTPVAIVLYAHRAGGIWVAGFVGGMLLAPLTGIGALRATAELLPQANHAFVALIAFGLLASLVSVGAVLLAFQH
jgi:hypothetical protein